MVAKVARVYRDEPKTELAAARASAKPLLVTRSEAGRLLNVCLSTVLTLEQRGKLTPIRLTGSPTGQVHFRISEVMALAEGGR